MNNLISGLFSGIKSIFIWLMLCASSGMASASITEEKDSSQNHLKDKFTVHGGVDAYFGYNSQRPINGNIPYLVSMNRHQEVNVNLAYVDVQYQTNHVRGRLSPGFGTYMQANYALEPVGFRNILEASLGFKPFRKKNLWLDAGIFGAPFTNENPISKDQLMYTRSLGSEFSPYYLSGLKLTIPVGKKLNFYVYFINGWQQIWDLNLKKSLATQLEYQPNQKNTINWNIYAGDERFNLLPQYRMRYFSDIYWTHNPKGKVSVTQTGYVGFQTQSFQKTFTKTNAWYNYSVIGRYRINDCHSFSVRLEYFSDPYNKLLILPYNSNKEFSVFSTSACYNYQIYKEIWLRFEGRYFRSKDDIYIGDSNPTAEHFWVTSNLTFWL